MVFTGGCGGSGGSVQQGFQPTPTPIPIVYTVTFNSNGESSVASVKISSCSPLNAPDTPTREGYVFAGWFKDAGFTEMFTFGTDSDKVTGISRFTYCGLTLLY